MEKLENKLEDLSKHTNDTIYQKMVKLSDKYKMVWEKIQNIDAINVSTSCANFKIDDRCRVGGEAILTWENDWSNQVQTWQPLNVFPVAKSDVQEAQTKIWELPSYIKYVIKSINIL